MKHLVFPSMAAAERAADAIDAALALGEGGTLTWALPELLEDGVRAAFPAPPAPVLEAAGITGYEEAAEAPQFAAPALADEVPGKVRGTRLKVLLASELGSAPGTSLLDDMKAALRQLTPSQRVSFRTAKTLGRDNAGLTALLPLVPGLDARLDKLLRRAAR